MITGRTIEASQINGSKLSDDLAQLQSMSIETPAGLAFTASEYNKLGMITSIWHSVRL